MVELTLLEKGVLYSIIGTIERLLDDLNENRRGDENFVKHLIDWVEYLDYIDVLKSLEKKGCLIITDDNKYFFIGECEYNSIKEGLEND